MAKIGKIIGAIVLLLVLVIGGLSLLVHFMLTEEKLKAILLPPAEKALGRQVTIGTIQVGLFSGIVIHDFTVKEQDGKTDFLSAKAFVLRYDLMPLLHKKLAISELSILQPAVRVHRLADGRFNYQSLALLSEEKKKEEHKVEQPSGAAAALPLALSIDRIRVEQASFVLQDDRKELPQVDATADLALSLNIGQDLKSLSYNGTLALEGNAVYGEAKPHLTAKISFDPRTAKVAMAVTVDGQTVNADGSVADYRGAPDIKLDLTSKELDLDKLLALTAGLPKSEGKGQEKQAVAVAKKETAPIAASLPKGLKAEGKLAVEKATIRGTEVDALLLRYQLANGILNIKELGAVALGGSLAGTADIDLNRPDLAYTGKIDLSSVQADQLSNVFAKKAAEIISGSLQSSINFAGSGTAWDTIKNTLSAAGDFALTNGRIKETPLTTTVSALLGTDKLKNFAYDKLSGRFRLVKGGKVELKSSLNSADVKAETTGNLGLDGSLDLPLTLTLSPAITAGLGNRAGLGQLFKDSQGNTVLNLKVAGTLSNPHPTIDSKVIQQQIGTAVKSKILETLEKKAGGGTSESGTEGGNEGNTKDTVNKLLKGIFGK